MPNGRGLGYGDFSLDAQSLRWLMHHLPDVPDALTRGSAWLTLWDAMLDHAVEPDALLALAIRALQQEPSELNLQRLLACIERIVWTFLTDTERAAAAPPLEAALHARLDAAESPSIAAACFACLRSIATTPATMRWLKQLWAGEARLPGLALGETDLIGLTCDLAVRSGDGDALVAAQLSSTAAPDRHAALAFVAPALSSDPARREAFLQTVSDATNRTREPWVIDGLRWLHHPLREAHARHCIAPGLELLEEVQRTGDIFLPKRWLDATLGGHRSAVAAEVVRQFIATRPAGYPAALTRMVLASSDLGLIRSGGRFSYAACAARRSNAAGLICPSVECRRRWL
ncbi:MAG: ERAP1-like C-terminal domain-containing protein [Vicinamibacterales bacterium]